MTVSEIAFPEHALSTEDAAETRTLAGAAGGGELVEDELLVEEISIDGMCGVY